MKKILVTGAGGFVGSRILQQWSRNDALYTLPKGFFRTALICIMSIIKFQLTRSRGA